ncbi:MAG: amidohydrolase family protein [Gammaproteobacteria bacterium]
MRQQLAAIAVLIAGASLCGAQADTPQAGDTWLREGADLSVSASADGKVIVFGLIGRVWALNPDDGFARQLSADDELARRPTLSPDGKLVAYETVRDGFSHIMVRDANGELPRRITFGDFNHRSPSWSPASDARPFDGRRLIMSSDRGGRFGTWEIDVDTLDLQQLTFASTDEREPTWNDNGSRLAYVTDTTNGSAIYAVRPGEQPELLLRESATISAPAWRPGGGLLSYVRQLDGERQLRMLLLSTPAITKAITTGEDAFAYPAHWLDRSTFLYAADGQIRRRQFGARGAETVAFNARVETAGEARPERELDLDAGENRPVTGSNGIAVADDGRYVVAALGDLWEIRADGTLLRQLTNDPFVDAHPALSPDGERVAFVSDRSGTLQVWTQTLGLQDARRVTRAPGIALHPRWVRDGTAIEYQAAEHASTSTYRRQLVAPDGAPIEVEDESSDEPAHDVGSDRPFDGTAVVPLTWKPFVATGRRIVRAARIFDGLGPGYLERHEIVIDGDRITEIRPWTSATDTRDDDAVIIDATDGTALPGLIDLSVHQSPIGDERLGRKYLAYGVTTIREHVTNPAAAVERRESWHSGKRVGPRMEMTSTPCIDAAGGFVVRPVLQPAVAQAAFRAQLDAAVDRGSVAIGICPSLDAAARVDVIATTHAHGLPTIAANAFPDILIGADETRAPPPERAGYADFALLAGKKQITVTTNLAAHGLPVLIAQGEFTTGWQYQQLFTSAEQDWYRRSWDLTEAGHARTAARLAAVRASVVDAMAAGARVVTGSDAPDVPAGLGLHAELRLLVDAGLQPFQALRAATLDAGTAIGAGGRLGTIRPGAIADIVIVDGDPLSNIRDAASVSVTLTRGRPYTRRELTSAGGRAASVGILYN